MDIKLIEIRDKATFIPAMAIRLQSLRERELWLLRRAGYGLRQLMGDTTLPPYIILCKLDGVEAEYDPFQWRNRRTLSTAHQYLIDHWDDVHSGDLLDVEFILGEVDKPKVSERLKETG